MVPENEVSGIIRKIRGQVIPSSEKIVAEAFRDLGFIPETAIVDGVKPGDALARFNDMLQNVFEHTLNVLEKYEEEAYARKILPQICELRSEKLSMIKGSNTVDVVSQAVYHLYDDIWQVMLSRSQSRKQRGGKDWEWEIAGMLDLARIPYEMQTTHLRTDFLIPSAEAFERDRTKTILLSAKRSLRERWAQVAEEIQRTRAANAYLAIAEEIEDLPSSKVDAIWGYNVHLLVWDHVGEEYADHPGVMGYSRFANEEIEALQRHW
jgi:hypothetical protein